MTTSTQKYKFSKTFINTDSKASQRQNSRNFSLAHLKLKSFLSFNCKLLSWGTSFVTIASWTKYNIVCVYLALMWPVLTNMCRRWTLHISFASYWVEYTERNYLLQLCTLNSHEIYEELSVCFIKLPICIFVYDDDKKEKGEHYKKFLSWEKKDKFIQHNKHEKE